MVTSHYAMQRREKEILSTTERNHKAASVPGNTGRTKWRMRYPRCSAPPYPQPDTDHLSGPLLAGMATGEGSLLYYFKCPEYFRRDNNLELLSGMFSFQLLYFHCPKKHIIRSKITCVNLITCLVSWLVPESLLGRPPTLFICLHCLLGVLPGFWKV